MLLGWIEELPHLAQDHVVSSVALQSLGEEDPRPVGAASGACSVCLPPQQIINRHFEGQEKGPQVIWFFLLLGLESHKFFVERKVLPKFWTQVSKTWFTPFIQTIQAVVHKRSNFTGQ